MRILVLTNLYPPATLGGYEILCSQIVEGLLQRGHQVQVLTSDWGKARQALSPEYVDRSLRLINDFLNPPSRNPLRQWRTSRHNYQRTTQVLRSFQPEATLVFSQLRFSLGAARAAEDFGCPVLYSWNDEHALGYLPAAWSWKGWNWGTLRSNLRALWDRTVGRIERIDLLRLRYTCAISRCVRDNLHNKGLRPTRPTKVIYQGIPLEKFPYLPAAWPSKGTQELPVRLLYVGQLHHYKGVHTFIEAVALLAQRGHQVQGLVVGKGQADYLQQLQAQVAAKSAPVEFFGYYPHEELPGLYATCHLFVFPSIWQEPFGLTHLEAMACGLPVVSTTHGGQGEVLQDGFNCLSFPAEDSGQLADQLQKLLQDPVLRQRLAEAGRRLVEEKLNMQHYVAQLERWIEGALVP